MEIIIYFYELVMMYYRVITELLLSYYQVSIKKYKHVTYSTYNLLLQYVHTVHKSEEDSQGFLLQIWNSDLVGHYSRFTARILVNPPHYYITLLCYILQLYCMQTYNLPLKGELPS